MDFNQLFFFQPHGLLQFDSNVLIPLVDYLNTSTKCDQFQDTCRKIKKAASVVINKNLGHSKQIVSAPKCYTDGWLKNININQVPCENANIDLVGGKYEGGFKVWESTYDLVNFILDNQDIIPQATNGKKRFKALELGSGSSLASLALLRRLASDEGCSKSYAIHLQDFNWEVLVSSALINLSINLPRDYLESLIDNRRLKFYHGHWKDMGSLKKYHLIIMSEVLYNSDNYPVLHDLLAKHLRKSGYVVIATKNTYFGLTGGLFEWLEYVESRGVLEEVNVITTATKNIPRSVLVMRRRSS